MAITVACSIGYCIIDPATVQAQGVLDPLFNTEGYNINNISDSPLRDDAAVGVAVLSNGGYLVAGSAYSSSDFEDKFALALYTTDGSLQASAFASMPGDPSRYTARAFAKHPLVSAYYVAGIRTLDGIKTWTLGLFREDLSTEDQYGPNETEGYAEAWDWGVPNTDIGGMATQPDGKAVLAGRAGSNLALARFTSTGSLDDTFSGDGRTIVDLPESNGEQCRAVAVDDAGRIVVAGYITIGSVYRGLVGRFTSDGEVDTSFGTNGFTTINYAGSTEPGGWGQDGHSILHGLTIQPDGKIVVVGMCLNSAFDDMDQLIARLDTDGHLDSLFGESGMVKVGFTPTPPFSQDIAYSVVLDDSDAMIVAGTIRTMEGIGLSRVLNDGTLDTGFGINGTVETILGTSHGVGATILDGQKVVVVGGVSPADREDFFIARYLSSTVGVIDLSNELHGINIYPNPINEAVTFQYTLQESERLTIALHDMQGKVITTFLDGQWLPAGEHMQTVTMPADLASGNYLVVFSSPKGRMSVQVSK
jgi:uncharacterized delta-60 repeat protein